MNTLTRRSLGLVLAAGLGVSLAACGEDTGEGSANGKVTITVNGQPPKTQPFERKIFDEDVAEFERTHKNIDIQPREGFMDPKTFNSKLAGGQLEDVFYVYLTDPANLIARRQAADISDYVKDVPHYDELQPALKDIFTKDGRYIWNMSIGEVDTSLDDPIWDWTKGDRHITIVDTRTFQIVRTIDMRQRLDAFGRSDLSNAVRPAVFSPDGSKLYFHVSFFNAFVE